ncbi:MAG: pyridoxal-phosphate dependent enzyme [Flavobacteriales bacterium]|nr:pyridoxal-phosphate dependent enzyme [Flavobacteriales bacterium]
MDAIDYAKSYRPTGSPVQEVNDLILKESGIRLLIKRDDLIHQHISGNKWRKLKYNLSEAVQQNHHTMLTFGGAYSNHIAATAFACKKAGLESIGIIRGENDPTNPTLKFAREHGMQLHFVSRDDYRKMTSEGAHGHTPEDDVDQAIIHTPLQERFGRFFLIPEGGANGLGVRGCAEILPEVEEPFDIVCCAAGTATTLAGLALSLPVRAYGRTPLLGFPALKGGDFLSDDVERLILESNLEHGILNLELIIDYHFGGYAKVKPELLDFIHGFTERTGIPLDPIYTGKMMFGIYDLAKKGHFAHGTRVLAIHTGGLQGWEGMRHRSLV